MLPTRPASGPSGLISRFVVPRSARVVDRPTTGDLLLEGEIDLSNCDRIVADVVRLCERGAVRVRIDLGSVTFIDASAVRAFIIARRRARDVGGDVVLVHVGGLPLQVLQLVGLDGVLIERERPVGEPADRRDVERSRSAGDEVEGSGLAAEAEGLADERERLADERERLADERERTADEQERLADERERLADLVERTADAAERANETAEWAQDQLLRAEARVRRSLAEEERARAAVERISVREERACANADREAAAAVAAESEGSEASWASDRRAFVAADRESVADRRDVEADLRDELAHEREQEADERDRAARGRDARVGQESDPGRSRTTDRDVELAAGDLANVREAARRQRAAAEEARRRASADRAAAGRRRRDLGAADPYGRLAGELSSLSRELFSSQDLFAVAERVTRLSIECVAGAVATGVTLFEGVRPLTHVATDEIAKRLDVHQIDRADGPIAESIERREPVLIGDLRGDGRWPELQALAAELGVAGVVACELVVRRPQGWQSLGALTVYGEEPGALTDESRDAAALFAAHLSIVAGFDRDRHDVVQREAALHRALGSRDVIGQAKGILMERQRLTAGEAYDVLRRSSQQLNVKLSEVAARLAETGELPM